MKRFIFPFFIFPFSLLFLLCRSGNNGDDLPRVSTCCMLEDGSFSCPPSENFMLCKDFLPYIKDDKGRYIYFHGVNLGGDGKYPVNENPYTFRTNGVPTWIGRPFPPEEADNHFQQLKNFGFNVVRLILQWEAIMPNSPYEIDDNYLNYIIEIIKKAKKYKIYVLVDFHQDAFSRHLIARFNDLKSKSPFVGLVKGAENLYGKDSLQYILLASVVALLPCKGCEYEWEGLKVKSEYNNAVRGDGAPLWAVKAVMPERNIWGKWWGYPRILLNLRKAIDDRDFIDAITRVVSKFAPQYVDIITNFLPQITNYISEITEDIFLETSDFLPFTNWGTNALLSLDVQRCFASFFAGKSAYPQQRNYEIKYVAWDGKEREVEVKNNIQDFLQEAYAKAWGEVAKKISECGNECSNVVGYDIMNEPLGNFLLLTLASAIFQVGSTQGAVEILKVILGDEQTSKDIVKILAKLGILPDLSPNLSSEEKEKLKERWGFKYADFLGILGLNYGFDRAYMQPFYEKVGMEIQKYHKDAIIWFEPALGTIEFILESLFAGGLPIFDLGMTRPRLRQVVLAPHFYADIYPFPGFNVPMRKFPMNEIRLKDYRPSIKASMDKAIKRMGNIPVVFGEFGTYWSLRLEKEDGKEVQDWNENYPLSRTILNNYYEAFEDLFPNPTGRILWVWSRTNTNERGEGWNSENFSIVVNNGEEARGIDAWSRPFPRAMSGKPKKLQFYSNLHYFITKKGEVNKYSYFLLEMESKETYSPTEIFIPKTYYEKGFYVWISDGYATYSPQDNTLYWYPSEDSPGYIHRIEILGQLEGNEYIGWRYYFKDDKVIAR